MSERTQAIWDWFNGAPLRVLVIFLVAAISHLSGHRAIDRAIARLANADLKPGPGTAKRQAERARTIGTVFSSTFNAAVWIIAIGMILVNSDLISALLLHQLVLLVWPLVSVRKLSYATYFLESLC